MNDKSSKIDVILERLIPGKWLSPKSKRDIALKGGLVVLMLLFHQFFIAYMAEARHIEALMTGMGGRLEFKALMVLAFIGVRVGVVFVLPGFVLYWMAEIAWREIRKHRCHDELG